MFTVTVNPATIASDGDAMTCSDVALDFNLLGQLTMPADANEGNIAFTYTITSDNTAIDPTGNNRETATRANITDTYNNETSGDIILTYTVTPVITDGSGASPCAGDDFVITITVKPEPVVMNITAEQCSRVDIGGPDNDNPQADLPLSPTLNVGVASWRYESLVLPDGLVPSGGNANVSNDDSQYPFPQDDDTRGRRQLRNDEFQNLTNGPLDAVYTIIPIGDNGCEGDPFTVTVTIQPEPVGEDATVQACTGQDKTIDLDEFITNIRFFRWRR